MATGCAKKRTFSTFYMECAFRYESRGYSYTERKAELKEKLILISQDCDIKSDVEPYVEAFLCRAEKQKFLSKVGPKSARWFVIDFDTGLVAQQSTGCNLPNRF